jgi:arylsulfatase A-like enzyme
LEPASNMQLHSSRLRTFVVLAGIGLVAGGLAAWFGSRSSNPSLPDGAAAGQVEHALAADPAMPLDAAHTDVVLVYVCTFRQDKLQPYGNRRPTSPFLDALSTHGVVFEHLFTQAPWTRPSTGALETGRWPGVLQLDDPEPTGFSNRAIADSFTTIAEVLHGNGYHTVGASANPNVSRTFGFAQGFDVHREPESLWREQAVIPPSGRDLVDGVVDEIANTPADQRVFARLMFIDTHAPRSPAARARRVLEKWQDGENAAPLSGRVATYEAALRTLDGTLADLAIRARARRPNLLFVVIGDHGEGLRSPANHGQGHGNYLYRTTTEVPFLVFHPSLSKPGRRVHGLAQEVDLFPTLLELLGIPIPGDVDGQSLAPQVLGHSAETGEPFAYSETWFRKSHKSSILDAQLHLIRDWQKPGSDGAPSDELYDMGDRSERNSVLDEHPEDAARLRLELAAWEEKVRAEADAAGPPKIVTPGRDIDAQLKTLGYLDDNADK